MTTEDGLPPEQSLWKVQYLQLIAFPVLQSFQIESCDSWWRNTTEVEREGKVETNKEVELSGTVGKNWMTLKASQQKISWVAFPKVPGDTILTSVPTIGGLNDQTSWFNGLMSRWLATPPPLTRLAFRALLIQEKPTLEEANQCLTRLVSFIKVPVHGRDFTYRINVRKASSISEGLVVNRLVTWGGRLFEITATATTGDQEQTHTESRPAATLELDINTATEAAQTIKETPREKYPTVFSELLEFGVKIAEQGDKAL